MYICLRVCGYVSLCMWVDFFDYCLCVFILVYLSILYGYKRRNNGLEAPCQYNLKGPTQAAIEDILKIINKNKCICIKCLYLCFLSYFGW